VSEVQRGDGRDDGRPAQRSSEESGERKVVKGAINTITPRNTISKNATGMVSGGFLAGMEPVDLEELARQYPEAFAQPIDKATGLAWERMLA
jgi:hypothetical protein